MPSTIITCCILQNICLEVTDTTEVDITNDENENHVASLPGHDVNADGATLRNIISHVILEQLFYFHRVKPLSTEEQQ